MGIPSSTFGATGQPGRIIDILWIEFALLYRHMSYQTDIRSIVEELIRKSDSPATVEVTVARPGTFDMKVSLHGLSSEEDKTFDLSNGLTPRVRRSISDWFASVSGPVKQEKETPEPPRDLREEWVKEDPVIEGRKPNLEEIEEDAAAL